MTKEEQQQRVNNRPSASAEDADQHLQGQAAADAESALIDSWTKPSFGGGGRQQLQKDASFGQPERRTGK